jgi:hypothetical protein
VGAGRVVVGESGFGEKGLGHSCSPVYGRNPRPLNCVCQVYNSVKRRAARPRRGPGCGGR